MEVKERREKERKKEDMTLLGEEEKRGKKKRTNQTRYVPVSAEKGSSASTLGKASETPTGPRHDAPSSNINSELHPYSKKYVYITTITASQLQNHLTKRQETLPRSICCDGSTSTLVIYYRYSCSDGSPALSPLCDQQGGEGIPTCRPMREADCGSLQVEIVSTHVLYRWLVSYLRL